jgi:hypothetical protein
MVLGYGHHENHRLKSISVGKKVQLTTGMRQLYEMKMKEGQEDSLRMVAGLSTWAGGSGIRTLPTEPPWTFDSIFSSRRWIR